VWRCRKIQHIEDDYVNQDDERDGKEDPSTNDSERERKNIGKRQKYVKSVLVKNSYLRISDIGGMGQPRRAKF
jgi:hypothetical protein